MGIITLYHNGKKFIREIQRSDAPRRKKWFIGGSVVSISIILLLWIFYLSVEIPLITPPENTMPKQEKQIKTNDNEDSIFKTLERGIINISDDFKKRFGEFKNAIEKNFTSMKKVGEEKNTTYIQGARLNFVFDDLEPIPPTRLP